MALQFSGNADSQDLVSEIKRICGTDTNSYPLTDMTRRCNMALDRFVFLAATANGNWQFDDLNQTDLPIGTTNIFSGQQDYAFASDVLLVEKVLAKDSAGTWQELTPVDVTDSKGESKNIWTLPSSNSGSPIRYDKFANSLFLDPIPNYNSSSGLKVVFQRTHIDFDTDDNTKQPGIPSIFHGYIARHASLPFLIENQKPSKNDIALLIEKDEKAIKEYYSLRPKDTRIGLRVRQESNR
jgi:hypothetical protein